MRLCECASAAVRSVDALADSGAIVALLNPADQWHTVCVRALEEFWFPLVTSDAVLTEVFHFANHRHGMEKAWNFVRSGTLKLAAIQDSKLPQLHALMSRYWDRPMDFADATFVYLARRESISTIFTVDHADFETYRIEGHRGFRILPAARP